MRKYFLTIIASLFIVVISYAQQQETITFPANAFSFSKSTVNNTVYDVASVSNGIADYSLSGAPQLPVVYLRFIVPRNKQVISATIVSSQKQTITGYFYIYPQQPPAIAGGASIANFVNPNAAIYTSNNIWPSFPIQLQTQGYSMGQNIVTLAITPFEYLPLSRKISIYTQISLTFQLTDVQDAPPLPQGISYNRFKMSEAYFKNTIYNFNTMYQPLPLPVSNNNNSTLKSVSEFAWDNKMIDYVIITNTTLKPAFDILANWRSKCGIPSSVITIEEIAQQYTGVDLTEKIRNYLKELQQKIGSNFYVVLGGDVNIVPSRFALKQAESGGMNVTDCYYSNLDGNWNANGNDVFGDDDVANSDNIDAEFDVYVGRISVENLSEANTVVNKIISYEHLTNVTNVNYVNNILYMAGIYQPGGKMMMINDAKTSATNISTLNSNFKIWKLFDDYTVNNGNDEFNKANAIKYLNNGTSANGPMHIVHHMEHGGWAGISMSTTKSQTLIRDEVSNLINIPYYFIFYSNSCNSAQFTKNSIAESFVKANSGAVAYLGNILQGGTSDTYYFTHFINALYNNNTSFNGLLGIAYSANHMSWEEGVNSKGGPNFKLELIGDPCMTVWTKTPSTLTVNNLTYSNGSISLTLSGLVANQTYHVCIRKTGEIYDYADYVATGTQGTVSFTNVVVNTAGNIEVTVTAPNYIPLETTVAATVSPKHLFISGTTIVDNTNGNNDSKADAGESDGLQFTLKNASTQTLSNVKGVITVLHGNTNVQIVQGLATFGTVAPNATITNAQNVTLMFNKSTPNLSRIGLQLALNGDGGYSENITYYFNVNASNISNSQVSWQDATNDNIISVNENVNLYVNLTNSGNGAAQVVTATLKPATGFASNVNFTSLTKQLGSVGANAQVKNIADPFVFQAISGNPNNISLVLTLTDKFGNITTKQFALTRTDITSINTIIGKPTETEIGLAWTPVLNINGYNIYKFDPSTGGDYNNTLLYKLCNNIPITGTSYYLDMDVLKLAPYYYRVSVVSSNGLESALSSAIKLTTSIPCSESWPLNFTGIQWQSKRCDPTFAQAVDIDNDGKKEIFIPLHQKEPNTNESYLVGVKPNGEELYNIDNNVTTESGFAHIQTNDAGSSSDGVWAEPTIGDINNDGFKDILITLRNDNTNYPQIIAYSGKPSGKSEPDVLWQRNDIGRCIRGAVISDINNDGNLETILSPEWSSQIFVLDNKGNNLAGWPSSLGKSNYNIPAIADLDNNRTSEILLGYPDGLYILKSDGSKFGTAPLFYTQKFPSGKISSPVVADIDKDGKKEIIFTCRDGSTGYANVLTPDGKAKTGWTDNANVHSIQIDGNDCCFVPSISIGDINNDGYLEVVALGNGQIKIWNFDGTLNKTITNADFVVSNTAALIADVDGDPEKEIIVACSNKVFAYKASSGQQPYGYPLQGENSGKICIADVDGDWKNEIIGAGGDEGLTQYLWKTQGLANRIEWGSDRHDCYNTGEYGFIVPGDARPTVRIVNVGEILELGATTIPDYSIVVKSGGTLKITGNLTISGNNHIDVEYGAFICIQSGATINLQDALSTINLYNGSQLGVNPTVVSIPCNCSSSISKTGSGKINSFTTIGNVYVQNQTFTASECISGVKILAGSNVTTTKTQGPVIIDNSSNVVFSASNNIELNGGFEVKLNSSFETKSMPLVQSTITNPIEMGILSTGKTYNLSVNNYGMGNNYSGTHNQPSEDVYYKFTLAYSVNVTIKTCGSALNDTYIHLINENGILIAENDDSDNCSIESLYSFIQNNLTYGTYYIVVEGYGTSNGIINTSIIVN